MTPKQIDKAAENLVSALKTLLDAGYEVEIVPCRKIRRWGFTLT